MFVAASRLDIASTAVKMSSRKVEKYFMLMDMNGVFMDKGSYVNKSNVKKYKF